MENLKNHIENSITTSLVDFLKVIDKDKVFDTFLLLLLY